MNWIESMRKAISYMEEHLEEEIRIEEIAEKAFISSFYFQKAFRLLCGYSVGEYIRNRRLANAGRDVLTTEEKIIDISSVVNMVFVWNLRIMAWNLNTI